MFCCTRYNVSYYFREILVFRICPWFTILPPLPPGLSQSSQVCTLRPTNLPLKVLCFANLSLAKLPLHIRPVLKEIVQDRRIEPHGHRAVWRPVIVVIIAQRKILVGVVPGF